jgi:hypothetical protein
MIFSREYEPLHPFWLMLTIEIRLVAIGEVGIFHFPFGNCHLPLASGQSNDDKWKIANAKWKMNRQDFSLR